MSITRFAMAGALYVLFSTQVAAEPYQFEVVGLFGDGDFEQGSLETGVDTLGIQGTYFLRPVDQSTGPLALRAFLDTASSVSLGFTQVDVNSNDTDTIDVAGRFVTATDLIGIVELTNTDRGQNDETDYVVGLGKYLGKSSEAILTIDIADDAVDTMVVKGAYHRLLNQGAGTYIDYTASLSYIDNDRDDGFGLGFAATYYPSEILGISGSVELEDVGDNDTTDFIVGAEYFVNEKIAVGASYSMLEVNQNVDFDGFALVAKARF